MFMRGFSDELVKLAGESSGMPPISSPPEGETLKGKPETLTITPKRSAPRLDLPQQPPGRPPLVEVAKPAGPSVRPAPTARPDFWSRNGQRGVSLVVPIRSKTF